MTAVVVFNTTVPLSDIPTPLIFFTPQKAFSISLSIYIHTGSTTVLIWDILNNIRNDIRLLRFHKIGLPTVLYFITRVSLLAYSLGKAIILTAPVENCARFEAALTGLLIIFVTCTTLLFYIRVCAVYLFNKYIVIIFGTTWLATFAMSITFLDTFTAENIDPTRYCIQKIRPHFLAASSLVLLMNEIFTYLAVTYRMYRLSLQPGATLKQKIDLVVSGAPLSTLFKVILQDSQLYCLAIVLSKAFLFVVNSTVHNYDPPASVMFIISHLVIVNILACRVYRNLKLGHERFEMTESPGLNKEASNLNFATMRSSQQYNDSIYSITTIGTASGRPRPRSNSESK